MEVAIENKLTTGVMKYLRDSDLEKLYPALGDQLQFRQILDMLNVSWILKKTDFLCKPVVS